MFKNKESRFQAWIHGLPGFENPTGVAVEITHFIKPKPYENRLFTTLFASAGIISAMRKLSINKITIPEFCLVIRTDPKNELDDEYQLAEVQIVSVLPSKESKGALSVLLDFKRKYVREGVRMQPGPPPNAPEINDVGSNTGWILGMSDDCTKGIPFEITGFTPPLFNGKLEVHFEKLSPSIIREIEAQRFELILVLPDRAKKRYLEFKLWAVKSCKLADEQHWVLESDTIECLTG